MKKSMMGSSKYEYELDGLDKDYIDKMQVKEQWQYFNGRPPF